MGEYQHSGAFAGPSSHSRAERSQAATPEAKAEAALDPLRVLALELERRTTEHATTRDPAQWHAQREQLDKSLARATTSAKSARPTTDAVVTAQRELLLLVARFETVRVRMLAIPAPPAFVAVSREHEIAKILDGDTGGSRRDAFAAKEEALKQLFAQLDPVESRVLVERIQRPVAEDRIAKTLHGFVGERRQRLVAVLLGAPRRAAQRQAAQDMADEEDREASKQPMDVFRVNPSTLPEAPAPAPTAAKTEPIPISATTHYLSVNSNRAWTAISSYVKSAILPALDERFVWQSQPAFMAELLHSLHDRVVDLHPQRLQELLAVDVYAEVSPLLPVWLAGEKQEALPIWLGQGRMASQTWVPAVGTRLGQLVHGALVPSLRRMATRYIAAYDSHADEAAQQLITVQREELIASSPFDRLVGDALVAKNAVEILASASAKPRSVALRPVMLTWQGDRDPRLWNWVKAEPADATPEEVSASLFAYAKAAFGGESPTFFAHGLAVAPPLFGLPAAWALKFPEARARAPQGARDAKETTGDRLAALATTRAGDELAIQQAGGARADGHEVIEAATDVVLQLARLRTAFAPWQLADEIEWAHVHCSDKRDALLKASDAEVKAWAPVVLGQRGRLKLIGASVKSVMESGSGMGERSAEDHPLRRVLAHYARAVAASHLGATCEKLLAEAAAEQQQLQIKSMQMGRLSLLQATDELRPTALQPARHVEERSLADIYTDMAKGTMPAPRQQPSLANAAANAVVHRADAIDTYGAQLEQRLVVGEAVDPVEIDRAQVDTQEQTLQAKLLQLAETLEIIDAQAASVNASVLARLASLGSSQFRGLRGMTQFLREQIVLVRRDLVLDSRSRPRHQELEARRAAVARAHQRLASLQHDHDLANFITEAHELIDNQRLRTALVSVGVMVAVQLATSGAAALLARGLTIGGVAASPLAKAGVEILAQTVFDASTQTVLQGTDFGRGLLENGLMNLAMPVTVNPIVKDVGAGRAIAKEMQQAYQAVLGAEARLAGKVGSFARAAGHELIAITGHGVIGVALGQLTGRAIDAATGEHHTQGITGMDAALQGLSVAVGRMIHIRHAQNKERLVELARRSGPDGQQLRTYVAQLEALVHVPEQLREPHKALLALERFHELLQTELVLVEKLLVTEGHGGYTRSHLESQQGRLSSQIGLLRDHSMLEVAMHLHGMKQLEGLLWTGSAKDIEATVRSVRRDFPDIGVTKEGDVTQLRIDKQVIELHERAMPSAESAPARATKSATADHELSTAVTAMPGSTARGTYVHDHPAAPEALVTSAMEAMHGQQGIVDITRAPSARTYLVELADGTRTSVEVVVARVDGEDAGRLVPNTSRRARIGEHVVEGEHVIQISPGLPAQHMERIIASSLARIVWMHQQAKPSAQRPGGAWPNEGSVLTSDDRGRAAELHMLSRAARGEHAVDARAEIAILVEYLGLRLQSPEAKVRRAEIETLVPDAKDEIARALATPLTEAQRTKIDADLERMHASHVAQLPRHGERPTIFGPDAKIDPVHGKEQLRSAAVVAEVLREHRSQQTLSRYRAQISQGQRPKARVQRGGGAALAGRDPQMLLVDDRGRWQADGGEVIAQVAQQLQEVYGAGVGDVRELVGPSERVPLDALRFWQDTIAIRGDVINGRLTYAVDGGTLVGHITPSDGSAQLTIEIDGTAVSAGGFTPEIVPGPPRGLSPAESILRIREFVRRSGDAEVYQRLAEITGATDADLAKVGAVLESAPDLVGQMIDAPIKEALTAIDGLKRWDKVLADDASDGERQVFMGMESNKESLRRAAIEADKHGRKHWVFAGAGGVAQSGAEIILEATKHAEVTLVGRDTPSGLLANKQFRDMVEAHGDAAALEEARTLGIAIDGSRSSRRMHLHIGAALDFDTPSIVAGPNGEQKFALNTKVVNEPSKRVHDDQGNEIIGDRFVSALGSQRQFPPDIAALALEARRAAPPASSDRPSPVLVEALISGDGRYLGYRVRITIRGNTHVFDVTGAESRFIPREEFLRMKSSGVEDLAKIDAAEQTDAHNKSGVFGGGYAPTTRQTAARRRP